MPSHPFLKTRAWIPDEMFDQSILSRWVVPVYDEKECKRCPFLSKRPAKQCLKCEHYKRDMNLFRCRQTPEGTWWGLPNGNMDRVSKLTGIPVSGFRDDRPDHAFTAPIQFKFALYEGKPVNGKPTVNQRQVVDEWEARGYGIIKAPPRAGKTIMSVAAAVETGRKTIIIAHESRLIDQFYQTILAATNVRELEEQDGKTYVKILDNPDKDFQNPDLQIALTTYQKFIRDSSRVERITQINERFSMGIVDEIHQASSPAYAKFLSNLSLRYKLGLSATPLRKDGLNFVMEQVWGPVVVEAATIALTPRIELVETGFSLPGKNLQWTTAIKGLSMMERRIRFIVDEVFADIKAGRKAIIIPVDQIAPGLHMTEALNAEARRREENGECYNATFAAFYSRQSKKEGLIEKFDSGKISVLVAMRSMIKQGVDFQLADALYMIVPMSAAKDVTVGAPLFQQLAYRVGTWIEGKKDPVLKLFIDNTPLSFMCAAGLFRYEIGPGVRSHGGTPPKYLMNEDDQRRARVIMREGRNYTPTNDPGERIDSSESLSRSMSVRAARAARRQR